MERRKRILIQAGLQLKIGFLVLLSMLFLLAVTLLSFYFSAGQELVKLNHPRVISILAKFNYAIVISFIISAGIMFLLTIYITHKIAGPLYRFKKSMEVVGQGDLTHVVRTRKGDELKDLEVAFNQMITDLRQRVINGSIKTELENSEPAGGKKNG